MTREKKKTWQHSYLKRRIHDFDLLLLVIHGTNAAHHTDVGRGNLRLGKGMAVGRGAKGWHAGTSCSVAGP